MGLYDDNDSAVTRPVGGWAAASQQARNLQMHQQKMAEQRKQQTTIQQPPQIKQQIPTPPKPTGFTPSKFMPMSMSRGSNLKKVPRPGYKPVHMKSQQKPQASETEYISRYQDEYDPIKPNEFSRYLRRRREGKHKVTRYAEQKKSQERDYKRQNPREDSDSSDDEAEKSKRQKAMGMGKAMIAPPSALYTGQSSMPNLPAAKNPDLNALGSKTASRTKTLGSKLGFGQPRPSLFGKSVPSPASTPSWTPQQMKSPEEGAVKAKSIAESIMEKYGHKEGAGLGKSGQGISAPLEVEKTSRRGGKIIGGQTASYGNFTSGGVQNHATPPAQQNVGVAPPRPLPNLAKPTKVICLQNMVDPEEIDSELSNEVSSECIKYGAVANVKIVEVPNVPKESSVRIFIEFSRMEEAMKAVIGLHNRIFGGRRLIGGFYDFDQYSSGNVTENML